MRRRDSSGHAGAPWQTVGFAAVALVALALLTTPAHAAGLLVADGGFGGVLEMDPARVDGLARVLQTASKNRHSGRLWPMPLPT